MRTYIKDLSKHVGEEVTLKGWLYNMRSSGKLMFPQLRDGTGIVQGVVVKNSVTPELWETLKPLGQESSLIVTARARRQPSRRGRRGCNGC
jgi:asparaginyl-tRNA synthetase